MKKYIIFCSVLCFLFVYILVPKQAFASNPREFAKYLVDNPDDAIFILKQLNSQNKSNSSIKEVQKLNLQFSDSNSRYVYFSELASELSLLGDTSLAAIASSISYENLPREHGWGTSAESAIVNFKNRLKIPNYTLSEISIPTDNMDIIYLDMLDVFDESRNIKYTDSEYSNNLEAGLSKWLNRARWLIPVQYNNNINNQRINKKADNVNVRGQIILNGFPAAFRRVMIHNPIKGFQSTGGWRSYISGMDSMVASDIYDLPTQNSSYAITDENGNFNLQISSGGPYHVSIFNINKSSSLLVEAKSIVPKDSMGFKNNQGWFFSKSNHEYNLGKIAIDITKKIELPRPVLDVISTNDLGRVNPGEDIVIPIRIANQGGRSLSIQKVVLSCSCSSIFHWGVKSETVNFPVKIKPHEEVIWGIRISTSGLTPRGEQSKNIAIFTDDPATPSRIVKFHYSLEPLYTLVPQVVRLDNSKDIETVALEILSGKSNAKISQVYSMDDSHDIKVKIIDSGRRLQIYQKKMDRSADRNTKYNVSVFAVKVDDPNSPPLKLRVFGHNIKPENSKIKPNKFDFRMVRKGAQITRSISFPEEWLKYKKLVIKPIGDGFQIINAVTKGNKITIDIRITGASNDTFIELVDANKSDSLVSKIPLRWSVVE